MRWRRSLARAGAWSRSSPMARPGKCRLLTRSGRALSDRAVFDATAPLLAGFEAPAEFVF